MNEELKAELNEIWKKIETEIPDDNKKQLEKLEEEINKKLAAITSAMRVNAQIYFDVREFINSKRSKNKSKRFE